MYFNGVFFGVYVASVFKSVALGYIGDKTLTIAGSMGAFINGSSRLLWATLQDKYGFKSIYIFICII